LTILDGICFNRQNAFLNRQDAKDAKIFMSFVGWVERSETHHEIGSVTKVLMWQILVS
jgi:hypothetical protein